MKNKKLSHQKKAKLLGTEREGLLVTTFGANGELEDETGTLIRCHLRKNASPVITGDRVYWIPEQDGTATVVDHLPRKSLLARPENIHKLKPIAANIDAIIIVTSPPPVLSEDMLDRYLIAAENAKIHPVILLNKMDLLSATARVDMEKRLSVYKNIGYSVIFSSTKVPDGLADLDQFIHGKTCVLVGASGVGKSSIISDLTASSIVVGEVSNAGLGKHTTTTTRLYHLPKGGNIIDSPGVREFGLWNIDKEQVLDGFAEFKPFLGRCKYRNCHHDKEPGCAIREAVERGGICARRFQSYLKILEGTSLREKGGRR